MENLSNQRLVELCLCGDESAWAIFLNRFSGLMAWAIRDRLGRWGYQFDEKDVADIRQDVVSSLWERRKLEVVQDSENIAGWLAMVSGNAASSFFRKKNSDAKRAISIFEKLDDGRTLDEIIASDCDVRRGLERGELQEHIEQILQDLPEHERLIVILSYLYDKKHREIADILKVSVNTVSTIIRRTREKIRWELNKMS